MKGILCGFQGSSLKLYRVRPVTEYPQVFQTRQNQPQKSAHEMIKIFFIRYKNVGMWESLLRLTRCIQNTQFLSLNQENVLFFPHVIQVQHPKSSESLILGTMMRNFVLSPIMWSSLEVMIYAMAGSIPQSQSLCGLGDYTGNFFSPFSFFFFYFFSFARNIQLIMELFTKLFSKSYVYIHLLLWPASLPCTVVGCWLASSDNNLRD